MDIYWLFSSVKGFYLCADKKMKVALVAVFLLLVLMVSDAQWTMGQKDKPTNPRDEIETLRETMKHYDLLKDIKPAPVRGDAMMEEREASSDFDASN